MKLKFYNPETAPANVGVSRGKATIRISKSGCFALNMKAAEVIGIKAGATIHVTQDEENPKDWYLAVDEAEKKGYPVRAGKVFKSGPGNFMFNAAAAGKALLASLGITEGRAGFLIGAEPVDASGDGIKFFAIITSARK